jgi:hypothetical protein
MIKEEKENTELRAEELENQVNNIHIDDNSSPLLLDNSSDRSTPQSGIETSNKNVDLFKLTLNKTVQRDHHHKTNAVILLF